MTYHGRVKDGVIVLDNPADLPEGMEVEVRILSQEDIPTLAEELKNVIGKAEGFPPDSSRNHDHYLYGTPKREPPSA